jgi:hypothetical protein
MYVQWYRLVDWEWIIEDSVLLEKKTKEAESLILGRYSIQDQIKTLMYWDEAQNEIMKTFIKWISDELEANWKDADFSIYYE